MKKNFYVIAASIVLIAGLVIAINSLARKKSVVSEEPEPLSLSSLYDKTKDLEMTGAYSDAKLLYTELLEKAEDEEFAQKIKSDLMNINMKILFSPAVTEESEIYIVKEGDTLGHIAKRFNTTVELIMWSNSLEGDLIRTGQKLKVSTATYSAVVDRSLNILTLKAGENVLRTYRVSTGIDDATPVGIFKIVNKLKDPVWYKAGAVVPSGSPENILGSRWMGISVPGYGIHGTTEPETIGMYITAGCVRMKEPDVQELYAILPIGTEVTIVD